ncbi:MAG: hypothetical protein K6V73_07405 [Firmicutes bacterium]|nr:hypothetical protein [Bacillota bacterium]
MRPPRVRYRAQRQGSDMWVLYAVVYEAAHRRKVHKVTDVLCIPSALADHDPPLSGARPLARKAGDVLVFRLEGEHRASRVLSPSHFVPHLLVLHAGGVVEGDDVQGPYRTSDPNWVAFVAFRPERAVVRGADRMPAALHAQPVDVPTPPVAVGALPVFGDAAPDIRVTAPEHVAALVLGRERPQGERRRRPRESFTPPWADVAGRIWSAVRAMGSGTYFLRAYDADDELLWSLGFDYAAGLEQLALEPDHPIPPEREDGEEPQPVVVVLRHRGCRLAARNAGSVTPPPPAASDGCQRFAYALPLDRDRLALELVTSDGRRLDISLPVRRLRWRLMREGAAPLGSASWGAHTLRLPVDALRADSPWRLEIDLPWSREAPPLTDEAGRRLALRPRRTDRGTWSYPLNALYGVGPEGGLVAHISYPDGSRRNLHLCRIDRPTYPCPLCPVEVPDHEALTPHIIDRHHDAFFQGAPWRAYVADDETLPELVYQCECGHVIRADTSDNATSAMNSHQTMEGTKGFKILADPEEVLLALQLQHISRLFVCEICHDITKKGDEIKHLLTAHGDRIVQEARRLGGLPSGSR